MAWFRNHYVCLACDGHWIAEGAEAAEADCPHCRAYDVAAYRSDNLVNVEKELVATLRATAEKMRGMMEGKVDNKLDTKARPVVRSRGRGAARVAVH